MECIPRPPRWPLWLWLAQLPPAAGLLALGRWRLAEGLGSSAISGLTLAAAGLWVAVTLLMAFHPAGRRWIVSRWKDWGLAAGIVLCSMVIGDLMLSVTGVVPTIADQRSRSIAYTFNRAASVRLVPQDVHVPGGPAIHINRRGLRGPEIDPVKTPGRRRIAFLGGSHVFDYRGGGWPSMVGEELVRLGHDVEIINAGVPGTTTVDSLFALLTDLWALQPDVIFLCQAWNDIKYFGRLGPAEPYRGMPPLKPEPYNIDWRLYPSGIDRVLTASAVYRQLRQSLSVLAVTEEGIAATGGPMPANGGTGSDGVGRWGIEQYRLNLQLIAKISNRIGAQLVLCRQAHLTGGAGISGNDHEDYVRRNVGLSPTALLRAYEACNEAIDALAGQNDLSVVDMHGVLAGRHEYFWDSVHFAPAGSRAAATIVAAELEPLLTPER